VSEELRLIEQALANRPQNLPILLANLFQRC
jgi:hypothetical protein